MKVTGVQHVALVVTDVDRDVRFYTDVLGCEVVTERPDFGLPGAWLRAFLRDPSGNLIELNQPE